MSDASSDDAGSMAGRVGKAGEAIGEHLQSAKAATAAAAGQAKKVLGGAGETAGEVAKDVVDASRRAKRQIDENPLISVLVGCALGYIAGWWIHGWTTRKNRNKADTKEVSAAGNEG